MRLASSTLEIGIPTDDSHLHSSGTGVVVLDRGRRSGLAARSLLTHPRPPRLTVTTVVLVEPLVKCGVGAGFEARVLIVPHEAAAEVPFAVRDVAAAVVEDGLDTHDFD